MPMIRLDDNAYQIIVEVKRLLRNKGIRATYSDAIRYLFQKATR